MTLNCTFFDSANSASSQHTFRLLFVGAFPKSAGLERYVSGDLALRLKAAGWEVRISSRSPGRLTRVLDVLRTIYQTQNRYQAACVDVFSGSAFFWAEAAAWALRRLNKPYLLTLHGGNLPEFAARWPNRVRRLLGSAKIVTAPSAYLKEKMSPYHAGIRILPNPIDICLYPYRKRVPAGPNLVWLRAFHELYNPVMAVRVLGALASERPDVSLVLVGPDKGDGSLERARAEAIALGLGGRIQFLGPVPKCDVPNILSQGDIFLNTSNADNTPVSVIEAMACGLCVVTTDVGGIPFLLRDRIEAILVPRGDSAAMANAVRSLLANRDLAQKLVREGRRKAESFDWTNVFPRWVLLLQGMVSGVKVPQEDDLAVTAMERL